MRVTCRRVEIAGLVTRPPGWLSWCEPWVRPIFLFWNLFFFTLLLVVTVHGAAIRRHLLVTARLPSRESYHVRIDDDDVPGMERHITGFEAHMRWTCGSCWSRHRLNTYTSSRLPPHVDYPADAVSLWAGIASGVLYHGGGHVFNMNQLSSIAPMLLCVWLALIEPLTHCSEYCCAIPQYLN